MPRWVLPSVLIVALAVAAWPTASEADEPPTVYGVASELISQCGAGVVLSDHDCGVARSMKASIQEQIDAGKTKEEILDRFVAVYGEQVLATPPKSGFGLAAWVTPLAVIAAGAAVLCALTWFWATRRPAPAEATAAAARPGDLNHYRDQVDEDLRHVG